MYNSNLKHCWWSDQLYAWIYGKMAGVYIIQTKCKKYTFFQIVITCHLLSDKQAQSLLLHCLILVYSLIERIHNLNFTHCLVWEKVTKLLFFCLFFFPPLKKTSEFIIQQKQKLFQWRLKLIASVVNYLASGLFFFLLYCEKNEISPLHCLIQYNFEI